MHEEQRFVEVFADVGCPFTHLGLRRFVEERAARGRDDVGLLVRSWPLEIVNGTPLDPRFIADEIDDIRAQVAPDAFGGFREAAFPASSLPAMTLASLAYEESLRVGELVSLELRDLLFEQGVDVGSRDVLIELAGRHGLSVAPGSLDDPARVDGRSRRGCHPGRRRLPALLHPGGAFFCPALDVHRDGQGHLRIHADPAGFDAFLRSCFV